MQVGHIFLKESQGHDGFLTILNLIDKQKRLTWNDGRTMHSGHLRHDTLYVKIWLEQGLVAGLFLQVNFNEVLKLLSQMLHSSRFSYLSGTS